MKWAKNKGSPTLSAYEWSYYIGQLTEGSAVTEYLCPSAMSIQLSLLFLLSVLPFVR